MSSLLFVFLVVGISILIVDIQCGRKTWEYTILQVESSSTHPDIIQANLRATRITRGTYGVTGNVTVKQTIDDGYSAEVKIFRSHDASGHYQLTPYQVPRVKVSEFLLGPYKRLFMSSVKDCSNLPQYDKKSSDASLQPNTYTVNQCLIKQDDLPDFMQQGYYKLMILGTKFDDSSFQFLVNITGKIDQKLGY